MKKVKLFDLPIEWKRGNGLQKSDLEIDGEYKCVLYGELFTKHKNVLIDSDKLSRTNKIGSVKSKVGDVLVPGTSTAVKRDMILAREIDEEGVFLGGDINIIRPQKDLFAKKFAAYYFETIDAYEQLEGYINGATGIIHISNTGLKNLEIPLPSIPEQQRIVDILDETFASIAKAKANAEQNLKNAKELFESYLQGVFENKVEGWVEKTLDDIIESNIIGLTKNSKEQGSDYEYKYVKMNNITRDNRFDLTKYTCVNATKLEAEKYCLSKGDLLFNTRNSYELVGKTCLFDGYEDEVILYNNNIMRIRFIKTINSHFIIYSFTTKSIIKKLEGLKSGTTNVSAIYYKDLKNLKLLIPPISQQKIIVQKLDALSAETKKLEAIYQQKINDLEELKKSILQKAFNGELNNIKSKAV